MNNTNLILSDESEKMKNRELFEEYFSCSLEMNSIRNRAEEIMPRPASSIPGSFTPRPVGSSVGIGAAKPSFGLNSQPAAQPKPPVKVDVSKIKVGVKVKHKAFGVGTVAAIQPDMVTVRFGNVEKKFLLPAAIVQGYLSLMEN